MSRIGNQPISLAEGVSVEAKGDEIHVKGPKGKLSERIPSSISVHIGPKEGRRRPCRDLGRTRGRGPEPGGWSASPCRMGGLGRVGRAPDPASVRRRPVLVADPLGRGQSEGLGKFEARRARRYHPSPAP